MNAHRLLRSRTTLPPTILQPRYFHATRPNRVFSEIIGVGFALSYKVFTGIHSITSLPWAVSIPLAAAAFRIAWLPIMYVTMKNQEKQKAWTPILVGWRKAYQTQAARKYAGTDITTAAEKAEKEVQQNLKLRRDFFNQQYKMMSIFKSLALQFSFLPMWFINATVIRLMVPARNHPVSPDTTLPDNPFEKAKILMSEPDFLQESPLWLTNLATEDTTFILPVAFGALMYANIRFSGGRSLAEQRREVNAMPPGSARRRRLLLLQLTELITVWALICPVLLIRAQTPAAVVLYLVGSAATQLVSKPLVARSVGYQKPISPAIAKEAVFKKEYRTGSSKYVRDLRVK